MMISSLPVELITLIMDYLDPVSVLNLRMATPSVRHIPTSLSTSRLIQLSSFCIEYMHFTLWEKIYHVDPLLTDPWSYKKRVF